MDINEQMNKAVSEQIRLINELVDKSIKRYCETGDVNFETMKKNKSLTREIHPNHESFFHHGIEIFRMEKVSKDFNNEGCSGTETTYSIREFF